MKHILTFAVLTALAACSSQYRTFFSEAGSQVDGGNFGNANYNNHQIHSGAKNYTINLANRFASEVTSTVNFEFNSTVLDGSARNTLAEQARWIRQFPEVRFKVYGHTDAVGSTSYNKNLGLRRANTVVSYLVSQGISRNRLEAVVSFGETQPLIVAQGRERRNRRTATQVSGFVESNSIILDGKYAEVVHREYIQSAAASSTLANVGDGGSFVEGN